MAPSPSASHPTQYMNPVVVGCATWCDAGYQPRLIKAHEQRCYFTLHICPSRMQRIVGATECDEFRLVQI